MSNIPSSVIKLAILEAQASTHRHKIGAVIFDKKYIISSGHNHAQRSVRSITTRFLKWENSIHAEVMAIIKARKDLKGASILILRLSVKTKYGLAAPCKDCFKYLQYVGIRAVFYTVSSDDFSLTASKI